MHIIYTLTQTPVSVVIKALKLEGIEEKPASTYMKADFFFLKSRIHHSLISNVHRRIQHMTSPNYEQPLQTQHK